MVLSLADHTRAASLKRVFKGFIAGDRVIGTQHEARLFFEAAKAQSSPGECLEHLIGSKVGLKAVRQSVRNSGDETFLCQHVLPFLFWFSDPEAASLGDGTLLEKLITTALVPNTAWTAIVNIYRDGSGLSSELGSEMFGWLCHQICLHPDPEVGELVDGISILLEERPLLDLPWQKTRELAHLIQKASSAKANPDLVAKGLSSLGQPGGRHDNDFADFRDTAVFPTPDELMSKAKPFLRVAFEVAEVCPELRPACHLDNQFRLYREDFLSQLREDIQAAFKKEGSCQRAQALSGLAYSGVTVGDNKRTHPCSVNVTFTSGLGIADNLDEKRRRKFFEKYSGFLGRENLGCLYRGETVVAFAFIVPNVNGLSKRPSILTLRFVAAKDLASAVEALSEHSDLRFLVVDTPWFAYTPVLERLKQIGQLPLQDQLLLIGEPGEQSWTSFCPTSELQEFASLCRERASQGLEISVGGKAYPLDVAQGNALAHALESSLSVIQGPPGTGKSFLGALIVKLQLQLSSARVLAISYTNHSTNQMLEDLCEIGIDKSIMTRLGSRAKASAETAALTMETQIKTSNHRLTAKEWARLASMRLRILELRDNLEMTLKQLQRKISALDLLDFLEISDDANAGALWDACQAPVTAAGFQVTGKKGKVLKPEHLLKRWQRGHDNAGLNLELDSHSQKIWALPQTERIKLVAEWTAALQREKREAVTSLVSQINERSSEIDNIFSQGKCNFAAEKRVIGCTTTSAAKNMAVLKAFKPTCILVEEAGEILEPHVLAALCPSTQQLVLIGDHKQLRPKVQSYALSVEKGDGFDLNRSLFERLVMQGATFEALQRQHRMTPEISQFVRAMTYPELLDGDKVHDRPLILGLRSRVAFINHSKPEGEFEAIADRRDGNSKRSKENHFEAEMVLKVVKYLGQQGYKSGDMVVLTPYLGQLRLLKEMLSQENDPVLNDLDSAELLRAGLITQASAQLNRGQIKLSTIDNYQGEESDIVIASLTRSNNRGDIGFMKAPERLNVLVSRARNCLVIIGNMETFMVSKQGDETWPSFFSQLKDQGYLHDGLQVRCERHPEQQSLLCSPADFELHCPEGGCTRICGVMLSCGTHQCPLKCHLLDDHSLMKCHQKVKASCEKSHDYTVSCGDLDKPCPVCVKNEERMRKRAQRDLELEKTRLERQEKYRQQLELIQDEIAHQKLLAEQEDEVKTEERTLAEHRRTLEGLQRAQERDRAIKKANEAAQVSNNTSQANELATVPPNFEGARAEWEALKRDEHAQSEHLDTLMNMIGLESVKRNFLDVKSTIDLATRQCVSLKKERFGCTLLGNPGTGKTTVARIYGRFLTATGVIPGDRFEETTGSKLASMGVKGCQALVDEVLNKGGGVVFIDEAYQLSSGNSPGGAAVLDFLLAEVENLRSQVVFVLAGYSKQMEAFFAHNPGFPSRFPLTMQFDDYSDEELLAILSLQVNERYGGRMKVELGLDGLYCRIVSRRLGRGRGKEGFGNARAVENRLAQIYRSQASRLRQERQRKHPGGGPEPDDLLLTKEDLIGPRPSSTLFQSAAWKKLQELIGLESVKESVRVLVDTLEANYDRELEESPIIEYNLNRVFLGNPGTGKTTVAKLYGQLLSQIGLLSNGEAVVKTPADFVGDVMGATENITKGILASTVGKVLVIDEAYSFYGGGGRGGGRSGGADPYKTAAIDTIVATVHSTPGDDRCVLLLGYHDQMQEMLQNMNPGLSRRFPLDSAFIFEDFDAADLARIFDLKVQQQGYSVTTKAREVALQVLERARNRGPNFGNAGEVDILLNEAKARHQKRLRAGSTKRSTTLEALDFDEEYDRGDQAETNIAQLFDGTVGCDRLIATLQGYQATVRKLKTLGMDPKAEIPFNFLFRGPPGTGKTSTARKMGKVFYDAGFLARAEVVECSTSELIGQYVGHTGPLVRGMLDKALGKVLFVDEAYRLASGGHFAQEALDELVDACTKERYHKRLIIILAGYEDDIDRLLAANSGLSSRFPEKIDFHALSPRACLQLLIKELERRKSSIEASAAGNSMQFDCLAADGDLSGDLLDLFGQACALEHWASARDVITLAASIFKTTIQEHAAVEGGQVITVQGETVLRELSSLIDERKSRERAASKPLEYQAHPVQHLDPRRHTAPSTGAGSAEAQSVPHEPVEPDLPVKEDGTSPCKGSLLSTRDAGVSDEIWAQLEEDAKKEAEEEAAFQAKLQARDDGDEEMRRRIVRELIEEEAKRKKEAELRERLEVRGLCPMGYRWIRQEGGYRCAGGSHFVSGEELSRL